MSNGDVGTTPRKKLTPTQRLKLFEKEKGICCICDKKIKGAFIDEHKRALGLGGQNDPGNRGVAHPKCADLKTRTEDMPRINKAKAQKKAHHGIKTAPKQPLQSRNDLPQKPPPKVAKVPFPSHLPSQLERQYGIREPSKGGKR
jgi:5-methylcytosine-specific restriction enzyme A